MQAAPINVTEGPSSWSTDALELIFQQEGTDKQARVPGHSYVQTYSAMLGPWRHLLQAMVEIGIGSLSPKMSANMKHWWWAMQNHHHVNRSKPNSLPRDVSYQPGASLRSWRRYFPRPARVIGLDIDPTTVMRAKKTDGVEAFVANASNPEELARVLPHDIDLIIDDGDHLWTAQQRTLVNAWPYLRAGGYYFIEDVDPIDFYNESLRHSEAHSLMAHVGAMLIHPDPYGRDIAAKGKRKGTRKVRLNTAHLVFLRKPIQDLWKVNVKSRLPADDVTATR